MCDENRKFNKDSWAVGGGVLSGLGIGFFFLPQSALYFTGCIITGLGLGLIITALLSKWK